MPSADSLLNPQVGAGPSSRVPLRIHARAIAALGRDLVTDDVVAVMELVKNSYDAMATRVDVRIHPAVGSTGDRGYIEVVDNGHGMDYDTIRDVWCVISTPNRAEYPVARSGRSTRAVTGDKGLGRLAAARLGDDMIVRTKTTSGPTLEVSINWNDLFGVETIEEVSVRVSRLPKDSFEGRQGTTIRMGSLRNDWTLPKIDDLEANLARLISPFGVGDFAIHLEAPNRAGTGDVRKVRVPDYMSRPKYQIAGKVDVEGAIHWRYDYQPIGGTGGRKEDRVEERIEHNGLEWTCGPFDFEIRAWDLSAQDTRDIAEHYSEARSRIRGIIREHRGISLYRDEVLVLPKSERARDWLGLDLRRVSRVGRRLSTSQVVGYVRITRAANPDLKDTSDREGLADSPASAAFRSTLLRVAEILENERDADREGARKPRSAKDLFESITAATLVSQMEALREEGGNIEDAISLTRTFANKLERGRADIERRFGYYNRLAVVGTIALTIVHEIRNHTTVIGHGLRKAAKAAKRIEDTVLGRAVDLADGSVVALERLADRFAPLARRGYRLGRRNSVLEEAIARCCEILARELRSRLVSVEAPTQTQTCVRIDPSELDSVILNLMTNSLYWMSRRKGECRLRFRMETGPTVGRITISVDDTGPGINTRDRELVFRPGWTRKPKGIGMGLVVASELIEDRGGQMRAVIPGELGGATFEFDLQMVNRSDGETNRE